MSLVQPFSKVEKSVAETPAAELLRFFDGQKSRSLELRKSTASERIQKLKKLEKTILARRAEIQKAVFEDLRKGQFEADLTEISTVLTEIRHTVSNLRGWMRPQNAAASLLLFGTFSETRREPKGRSLIISPWNYPFNLTLIPLVSAIAAGCTAILKPSEMTPASSALLKKIVAECFDPSEAVVVEGALETSSALLGLPFDHIFFTGSPAVGKIVMRAAAENLASVTLELGGKSPVIVDESANLAQAVPRIAWLKAMNAGQICIEPDYLLVHRSREKELLERLGATFSEFYGKDATARQASPDLCRIVNARHFSRVKSLLEDAVERGGEVVFGGSTDEKDRFIEPTVLKNVPLEARIWEEEIFGPVLPVRVFDRLEEAFEFVNERPNPLASYFFSTKNSAIERFLTETTAGMVTINDAGHNFLNANLPFGGAGNSGIGKSHGEHGFLAFSNEKSVLRQNRFYSVYRLVMPPYGKLNRWLGDQLVRWLA